VHYSSLFVVRHVGTAQLNSLVLTRLTKSNVSSRDEPSGIWAYDYDTVHGSCLSCTI